MLVPVKWVKDYVDIDIDVSELSARMTMSGSKVESIETKGENISKVVVGRILTVEKHPDADKLLVCKVDTGDETIQIVTGAPNVAPGQLVPVALHGAQLPGGVKIKKGKLRGVASEGMMCSGEELELKEADYPGAEGYGIMILQEEYPLGMDIKDALDLGGDVIDFEITSNRPDCLSILGMAREIALTLGKPYREPDIPPVSGIGNISDEIMVVVKDTDLCPRYAARVVKDVKIGPSPLWMRRRLAAAGVRPINNIVDITNYVMLELGQPMHAFDMDKISGRTIIVRKAKDGEIIKTLDDKDRQLNSDMLVIADEEKALAVAGVMGGADSEISADTRSIVFESAVFKSSSVRTTSKALGLRSESSNRFEKGIDVNITIKALDRAVQLVQELGAGTPVNGVIDIRNVDTDKKTITVRWNRVNELLGLNLSPDEIAQYLNRAYLEACINGDYMDVTIPTFRTDISMAADLAEEVARIYGYDNIPMTLMEGSASRGTKSVKHRLVDSAKAALTGMGLYEVVTYSFTSPKVYESIGINDPKDVPDAVRIANPLGEDQSIMRTTLVPSILEVLSRNYNRRLDSCRIFELSKVFLRKVNEELPDEVETLAIGAYGSDMDFYALKGWIESILELFGITNVSYTRCSSPVYHPGRAAELVYDGNQLGSFGEIHPKTADNYQLNGRVYVAELNMDMLLSFAVTEKQYKQLPKHPAVVRDLAIVLSKEITAAEVLSIIAGNGGNLLEAVDLFDIYEGNQIPAGYKSMAYSLTFRAPDRTLKEEEVSDKYNKILKALEEKLNARSR